MSCVIHHNFRPLRIVSTAKQVTPQSPIEKEVSFYKRQLWFCANLLSLFLGAEQVASHLETMTAHFRKLIG